MDNKLLIGKNLCGFYGKCPLQEILGGNFVVVNEDLLNSGLGKVQSHIGIAHCLIKGIQLLNVWYRSTKTVLKPVQELFFLMKPMIWMNLPVGEASFLIRISPLMA